MKGSKISYTLSERSHPQLIAMGKSPNANQRLVFILLLATHAVCMYVFNIHQVTLLYMMWSVEQITHSGHCGA